LLVAERAGQVVGWIHGAEPELVESGRRCEILGLVVDPEHRRSGAGGRLVVAVEKGRMGCRNMGHHRRLAGPSPA
jgi:ribosomal protein S18 acetylase RimI-like enzyme